MQQLNIRAKSSSDLSLRSCSDQRRTACRIAFRAWSPAAGLNELGICRTSAYQAIKRGEIPSTRVGRRLLVPVPALDKMLGRDQA
jgi:hypothetical protein